MFTVDAPGASARISLYSGTGRSFVTGNSLGGLNGVVPILTGNGDQAVLQFGSEDLKPGYDPSALGSYENFPGAAFSYLGDSGWTYALAQTVSTYGRMWVPPGYDKPAGMYTPNGGKPNSGLDAQFPFPSQDSPQATIYKGMQVPGTKQIFLGKTIALWSFDTWLLCKPPNGIYVPVSWVAWNLTIVATWGPNQQKPTIVTSSHYAVDLAPLPAGQSHRMPDGGYFAPTTVFPVWTTIVPASPPFTRESNQLIPG